MPSELPGTILHNTTNTDPGSRVEGHTPTASAIYNSYPSIHWHSRTASLTSQSLASPLLPRALPSLPQNHHSDTGGLSGDSINTASSSSSNTSSWKPGDSTSGDTHISSWNSSSSQSSSNHSDILSSDALSIINHGILPQKRPGKHFRSVMNNDRVNSQPSPEAQPRKQKYHRVQHRGSRRFSVKRLVILSSSEDPSSATSSDRSRRYQPSAQSPDDFLSASTSIGNIAGSLSGSLFVPSSAGSNVSSSPVQTTSVSASGHSSQRDLEESESTLESKSSTSIDCSWNESTTGSSKRIVDDLPIAPTSPRRYRFPSSLPPSDPISNSSSANSSLSFHLDDDQISALESSSCRSRSSWTASADISSYQHTLSDRESSFIVEDAKATVMGPPPLPQHIREPSVEHPRTRRSVRQQVHPQAYSLLPLGPRHLELEYHLAHKELREAIINALKDLQYEFPRRSRDQPLTCNEVSELRQLILDANAPYVVQAKNRLDYANRRLDEALALGRTWNNTPISGDLQAPLVYPLFLPGDTESDSRKSAPGAATEMDKCQTNISSSPSSSSSSSKRIKSTTPTSIGPLKRRSSDKSEESKYTTY